MQERRVEMADRRGVGTRPRPPVVEALAPRYSAMPGAVYPGGPRRQAGSCSGPMDLETRMERPERAFGRVSGI